MKEVSKSCYIGLSLGRWRLSIVREVRITHSVPVDGPQIGQKGSIDAEGCSDERVHDSLT